jgi:putative ABC transport system permease protein
MRTQTKLSHRLRSLFRREAANSELNDELKFHLEREIQEKVAAGMSPAEARRETMLAFGGLESVREECKDMRKINWISDLVRDISFGARMLRKNPGFTAIALLTLALGIGANAAIFTLVRGVLLRPLVNRDENRLIYIRQSAMGLGTNNTTFSVPEIQDISKNAKTISEFGDFSVISFTMTGLGEPREVQAGVVGGSYFEVVGLHPVLGRLLDIHDDGPNAPCVAVLTYPYWTTVMKKDTSVLGKTARLGSILGNRNATIVGVLEPSIPYPDNTEIIANISCSPHHLSATMNTGRLHRMTELFGRLAPGATLDQARAELNTVYASMAKDHPDEYSTKADFRIEAHLLRDQITSGARTILLVLLVASGLVFIIACSNVANLILARTVRREGELAIRAALGATSGALRRTLLAENLLLCGAGALLGVLTARPMVAILARYASRFTVRALDLQVDSSMLWVGAGLALLATVLLAFVPRLPSGNTSQGITASSGSVRITGGTRRRLRVFAIIQIAASFMLLAGASSLLKTLLTLQAARTGLDTDHVLALNVPVVTYGKTPDEVTGFYRDAIRRIKELPGVDNVAVGMVVPWREAGFNFALQFTADGHVRESGEEDPRAQVRTISPGYFAALGVPILAGRDFNDADRRTSEQVVIISQSVAQRMFPNQDAVDRHLIWTDPVLKFAIGLNTAPKRIVGVAADLDDSNVVPRPVLTVYHPIEQLMFGGRMFVHTGGDPYTLAAPITRIIHDMSADQPVEHAATLADVRAEVLTPDRLNTFVFGGFAIVALAIAVVGVAGVLAFSVSARTREFGIRLAIGAQPRQLLTRVIVEGAAMAGAGIVVGAAGGFAVARLAGSFFHDMQMPGVIVVILSAMILLAAAVIASALPAARAARVDVIQALRAD